MFEKITNIIALSLVIGIILTICLLLRGRFSKNFEDILKQNIGSFEINRRYVILYTLIFIPTFIYIMLNLSSYIILYFYFFAGFLILGFLGYILTKNPAALLSGLIYPILYFNYWNIYTFNLIACLFAIFIILLMSNLIKWNLLKLFFVLLLIMDIILVFITKDMVHLGNKIVSLQIPILIFIPFGQGITIGLGDVFIIGLLCVRFTKEKEYAGTKSMVFVWITAALFLIVLFIVATYLPRQPYPATIFVALSFMGAAILFEKVAGRS
ncbi:Uncharacterised protein [uncultured archaeon]|nr:Uncharacterised protein [uncultured archaeon]